MFGKQPRRAYELSLYGFVSDSNLSADDFEDSRSYFLTILNMDYKETWSNMTSKIQSGKMYYIHFLLLEVLLRKNPCSFSNIPLLSSRKCSIYLNSRKHRILIFARKWWKMSDNVAASSPCREHVVESGVGEELGGKYVGINGDTEQTSKLEDKDSRRISVQCFPFANSTWVNGSWTAKPWDLTILRFHG